MIEWLLSHPGSAPFLVTDERSWSYAETLSEVESRMSPGPVEVRPSLTPGSVFDLIAGLSGQGLIVPPSALDRDPGGGWLEGFGRAGDETRLVVFTSGTGGSPRGVRLTLSNLEAASRASAQHLGHGSDDTWLLALPLHHVAGLSILVRSAHAGGSVYLTDGFDPTVASELMKGRVSMVSVVAAMLARVLDQDRSDFHGLRAVVVGGGPIPEGLLERAWGANIPALPSYGMTETFGQVATLRPGSIPSHRVEALPGVELRIEHDGRIAVAGDQVSAGYLGDPDRPDRWLVTNDRGELDPEGRLRVLGRADAVIVTGGENVDPARVEAIVGAYPGAGEVVVVGVPHEEWGMTVACLYTGDAGADELDTWSRSRLEGHAVPRRWLRVSAIPATGPGKPDRAEAARLAAGD